MRLALTYTVLATATIGWSGASVIPPNGSSGVSALPHTRRGDDGKLVFVTQINEVKSQHYVHVKLGKSEIKDAIINLNEFTTSAFSSHLSKENIKALGLEKRKLYEIHKDAKPLGKENVIYIAEDEERVEFQSKIYRDEITIFGPDSHKPVKFSKVDIRAIEQPEKPLQTTKTFAPVAVLGMGCNKYTADAAVRKQQGLGLTTSVNQILVELRREGKGQVTLNDPKFENQQFEQDFMFVEADLRGGLREFRGIQFSVVPPPQSTPMPPTALKPTTTPTAGTQAAATQPFQYLSTPGESAPVQPGAYGNVRPEPTEEQPNPLQRVTYGNDIQKAAQDQSAPVELGISETITPQAAGQQSVPVPQSVPVQPSVPEVQPATYGSSIQQASRVQTVQQPGTYQAAGPRPPTWSSSFVGLLDSTAVEMQLPLEQYREFVAHLPPLINVRGKLACLCQGPMPDVLWRHKSFPGRPFKIPGDSFRQRVVPEKDLSDGHPRFCFVDVKSNVGPLVLGTVFLTESSIFLDDVGSRIGFKQHEYKLKAIKQGERHETPHPHAEPESEERPISPRLIPI